MVKRVLVGEEHPGAKITNNVVVLIRDLRERQGLSVAKIAKRLGLAFGTVNKIVYYERRQFPRPPGQEVTEEAEPAAAEAANGPPDPSN